MRDSPYLAGCGKCSHVVARSFLFRVGHAHDLGFCREWDLEIQPECVRGRIGVEADNSYRRVLAGFWPQRR